MPVCISSGGCVDLGLDGLEAIHFLEKYKQQIDGVELVFAFPKDLLEFEFDEKVVEFLHSLSYNSVHMPFKEVIYENNQETKKLLEKAGKTCESIRAVNVVFHPHCIKNLELIESCGLPASIENLNKKTEYKGFQTVKEIKAILDKHQRLKLCVDTAHAWGNKINPTNFLELKEKISSVHVNTQWVRKSDGKIKEHGFLIETDKEQFEQHIPFLKMKIPKIIEADFYQEKVQLIEKEIKLLRKFEKNSR